MIKLILLLCIFINIVKSQYLFNSVYNIGDQIYINIINIDASTTKQLYINDYEITSSCSFYGGIAYKCSLPVASQIKSGKLKAILNGITIERDYSFSPSIDTIEYSAGYRVSTTGGLVTLIGKYFDEYTYDGANNGLQVVYKNQILSPTLYTIDSSTIIRLEVPSGTGYTPGKVINPLVVKSLYATNVMTSIEIMYQWPNIDKITYDESNGYFTMDGTDFGEYQSLITIYGCGKIINTGVQLIVPHYKIMAYYDVTQFGYLSCSNIIVGIDNQNSSSASLVVPPHITSVSTPPSLGGKITIKGLFLSNKYYGGSFLSWVLNMNGLEYLSSQCSSITSTILICNAPARSTDGKLTVFVKINLSMYTETIQVPYLTQQLYSISRTFLGQSSLVTIKGESFFDDTIGVTIGGVQCTSPQFIDSSTIQCLYSGSVPPNQNGVGLTVQVSTINGITSANIFYYYSEDFSKVVQDGDTLYLYGGSFQSSSISSIKVGSVEILNLCTIDSLTLISCLNVPSIPSGDITISGGSVSSLPFIWTPLITSISNDLFSTSGGEIVAIFGKYFELIVNNQAQQTLFISLDQGSQVYSSFTLKSSTEIQFSIPFGTGKDHSLLLKQLYLESNVMLFSYLSPFITSFSQNSTNLSIYGSNFGRDLSLITISIGSNIINNKRLLVADTTLGITIPWEQKSGELIVLVNGQQDSIQFKLEPNLVSIESPPVLGGLVYVYGTFINNQDFDNNNLDLNLVISNDSSSSLTVTPPCTLIETPITSSTIHYKYSCQIESGSGKFNSYIQIDGKKSNSISASYQSPTIDSTSLARFGKPTLISIFGSNFATPISIHIKDSNDNDLECTNPTVLSTTNVTCQFQSSLPKPSIDKSPYFNVLVNVNGNIASNNKVFKYIEELVISKVLQNQASITIVGSGFSSDIGSTTIFISSQDLTLECNINNDTTIVCSNLPLYILSGNIIVSNQYTSSNSFQFYFTPLIIDLGTLVMDPAGQETITITGRFFEAINPITNQDNNFKLLADGQKELTIIQMDGNSIIFKSLGGFGKNHYLVVSQNNNENISNQVKYSYRPPIISNLVQINQNQFSIDAQYFSSDNLLLNSIQVNDDQSNIIRPVISSDTNSLLFTINDGKVSNGQISLVVDGQNSNYLSIHIKPTLNSISLKPYLDGSSIVTIYGLFFSNKNYQTGKRVDLAFSFTLDNGSASVNNLQCSYINGEMVTCKGFIGYGNASLTLTKTDDSIQYVSNSLQFQFQNPIIVKSTSLYYKVPGNITITVESFSLNTSSLKILIQDTVPCVNPAIVDSKHITCYYDASVPPNQDQSSLEISVESIGGMIGRNNVFYYYESLSCPNNCSSSLQGQCNPTNGQCICFNDWEGLDCSIKNQGELPPPQVDDNGDTILSGGNQVNFTVSIVYLREIDIFGNQVKLFKMDSIIWLNKTQMTNNQSYYKGIFENETLTIELDVTFFNNSFNYDFAGDIISIPKNSIKYIITISNYKFISPLNSFQVIYNSKAKQYYNDGCGNTIETTSNSGTALNTTESVSWFQLISGDSVMDAKFSRRMFIDNKVSISDVSILSFNDPLYTLVNSTSSSSSSASTSKDQTQNYYNRLVSINTPYFNNIIQLDPSFNSLIRTSSSDSCNPNKWKIPVIIALCVVGGVAILVGIIFLIYKIYKDHLFHKRISMKLSNFN